MKRLTICLPEMLIDEVKVYCRGTGRSVSGLVRCCLERELGDKTSLKNCEVR